MSAQLEVNDNILSVYTHFNLKWKTEAIKKIENINKVKNIVRFHIPNKYFTQWHHVTGFVVVKEKVASILSSHFKYYKKHNLLTKQTHEKLF